MFIRFDVILIHERDRRIDIRQTDTVTLHDSKDRAYASHRAVKIVSTRLTLATRPLLETQLLLVGPYNHT